MHNCKQIWKLQTATLWVKFKPITSRVVCKFACSSTCQNTFKGWIVFINFRCRGLTISQPDYIVLMARTHLWIYKPPLKQIQCKWSETAFRPHDTKLCPEASDNHFWADGPPWAQDCTWFWFGAGMLLPSGKMTETGCVFVPSFSSTSSTSADTMVPL